MARAAGGISQRLKSGPAMLRSRSRKEAMRELLNSGETGCDRRHNLYYVPNFRSDRHDQALNGISCAANGQSTNAAFTKPRSSVRIG
jgi:hypothetical protein